MLNELDGLIGGFALKPDEESYYDLPVATGAVQSLYVHGVQALQRGMACLGRAVLPAVDRHGRLERRHEPRGQHMADGDSRGVAVVQRQ